MNLFADTCAPLPQGPAAAASDQVRFATLQIGDVAILGNAVSKQDFQRVRGFDIAWQVSTAAQAQPIFADFSDGGQIETSLHELTWSSAFGTVTDRLGTP